MKKLNGNAALIQAESTWRVRYGAIFSRTFASRLEAIDWARDAGYRLHAAIDNRPRIRSGWASENAFTPHLKSEASADALESRSQARKLAPGQINTAPAPKPRPLNAPTKQEVRVSAQPAIVRFIRQRNAEADARELLAARRA